MTRKTMSRTLVAISLLLISAGVIAVNVSPIIYEDECPFEGCSFGVWSFKSPKSVYKAPNTESEKLGVVNHGQVTVQTGIWKVLPGLVNVIGPIPEKYRQLDNKKVILLLANRNEDRDRQIMAGNLEMFIRIPEKGTTCDKTNPRLNCWLKVEREPISEWWVLVADKRSGLKGWVFVDKDIVPIDHFD